MKINLMLTHSKFMLQMSTQQWCGSMAYTSNQQTHISLLHQRKKLKIHITEIN